MPEVVRVGSASLTPARRRSRRASGASVSSRSTRTFRFRSMRSNRPRASISGSPRTIARWRSYTGGGTMRFTCPNSSSSSMKTTPFAVAGPLARDRHAGDRDRCAVRELGAARAARASRAGRCGRSSSSGCDADRDARHAGSRRASAPTSSARGSSGIRLSGRAGARAGAPRRPSPAPSAARDEAEPPEQRRAAASPRQSHAPDATSASSSARAELAPAVRGRARHANGPSRSRSATSARRVLLPDARDVLEPDPHRAALDRALRARAVHVGREHLDPVPLRVPHERRRRVEAHRLRVQERAEELGRVVVAQPRRLVREQRRTRPRATSGSRTRRSRRACRRPRRPSRASTPFASAPSTNRSRNASIASSLRLRLIARRSPSASPTLKPASAIATSSTCSWKTIDAERLARAARRAAGGRPAARSPGPRAAARAARCTGGRPSPGSARAARARPARSGRRGSRAACAGGSASARGSRSGSRRPCPRAGSRGRPAGRRAGCARGRSARRARRAISLDALLDGREHPEPEQVDLEEARVGARVLVPLAELPPLHRRRLDRDELDERPRRDDHPARVLRDVARQAGDLRADSANARQRGESSFALRVGQRRELLRDASSRSSRPRASRAARARRAGGRAPCRRRGSRRASGRWRSVATSAACSRP